MDADRVQGDALNSEASPLTIPDFAAGKKREAAGPPAIFPSSRKLTQRLGSIGYAGGRRPWQRELGPGTGNLEGDRRLCRARNRQPRVLLEQAAQHRLIRTYAAALTRSLASLRRRSSSGLREKKLSRCGGRSSTRTCALRSLFHPARFVPVPSCVYR